MKGLSILLLIVFAQSCAQSELPQIRVEEPTTYFEGRIENFAVKVHDVGGRCTVSYSQNNQDRFSKPITIDVGMAAPCDLVRGPWKENAPLSYRYGKGDDRKSIFILTGGAPSKEERDFLQPGGCGTEITKLIVFEDRIQIGGKPHVPGPSICPSGGLDEVWFAA